MTSSTKLLHSSAWSIIARYLSESTDLSWTDRFANNCRRHQSGGANSSSPCIEKSKSIPPCPFVRVTSTPIPCVRYCHPPLGSLWRPRFSGFSMSRGLSRFNSKTSSSAAALRCSIQTASNSRTTLGSGVFILKADNVQGSPGTKLKQFPAARPQSAPCATYCYSANCAGNLSKARYTLFTCTSRAVVIRKPREFETLPFLLRQLCRLWAFFLILVGIMFTVFWALFQSEAIGLLSGLLGSLVLFEVASLSLILVSKWLFGWYRSRARKQLMLKRRRSQGKRKLSLELGLPVLSKQECVLTSPRNFNQSLASYLGKLLSNWREPEVESTRTSFWVASGLRLERNLPRPVKQLRNLLEHIKHLVHPDSN